MNRKYPISFIVFFFSLLLSFVIIMKIESNFYSSNGKVEELDEVKIIDSEEIEIKYHWQVNIPKIDVIAPIGEGVTTFDLRNQVGHIPETGVKSGNICLAAHNNTANYRHGNFFFDRLDELEIGDKVYYHIDDNDIVFQVIETREVDEKDVSMLEQKVDTYLTLITCITEKHNQRLIIVCQLI